MNKLKTFYNDIYEFAASPIGNQILAIAYIITATLLVMITFNHLNYSFVESLKMFGFYTISTFAIWASLALSYEFITNPRKNK